jgi:hypothetical protein
MSNESDTSESARDVPKVSRLPEQCGLFVVTRSDGTLYAEMIHVCRPGRSACQCSKHVYPARATP